VRIPEASGHGFRNNAGAHSGITRAHIPDTWAAPKGAPRGAKAAVGAGANATGKVAEWTVTKCARFERSSGCDLAAS
jgi:hypothetical protein